MNGRLFVATVTALFEATSPLSAAEGFRESSRVGRALAGRVAGEPVSCINPSTIRSTTIVPGLGIVYHARGGKIYLNQPVSGQSSLNDWDVLVTEIRGGSICNGEVVKLIDPSTHMLTGLIFLGKFVPYTKTRS